MVELYLEVFDKENESLRKNLIDEPVNYDLVSKNKFANGAEFIKDSVYRRILNELTGHKWSFVPHTIKDSEKEATFIGLLVVPGVGVHTGVGTVLKNKKDNSNALSSAKTYAFKNACKEMGLAPNIADEDFEEELFENPIKEEKAAEKKKLTKTEPKKAETVEGRIKEIRAAYELEDEDDFIAFIQVWDDRILELEDMEDDDWEEFIEYVEKNKEKLESF